MTVSMLSSAKKHRKCTAVSSQPLSNHGRITEECLIKWQSRGHPFEETYELIAKSKTHSDPNCSRWRPYWNIHDGPDRPHITKIIAYALL